MDWNMASSAMNLQSWAVVVVQDRKLLKEFFDRSKDLIAKADKPAKLKERLTDPEFNIFYNAGTLIVICAKPARQHPDWDCCLPAQILMLAAHAAEIATCPIGLAWPALQEGKSVSRIRPLRLLLLRRNFSHDDIVDRSMKTPTGLGAGRFDAKANVARAVPCVLKAAGGKVQGAGPCSG
jgi:hypothetical protein